MLENGHIITTTDVNLNTYILRENYSPADKTYHKTNCLEFQLDWHIPTVGRSRLPLIERIDIECSI